MPTVTMTTDECQRPDHGRMNRDLLAEKLASTFYREPVTLDGSLGIDSENWRAVADMALHELLDA